MVDNKKKKISNEIKDNFTHNDLKINVLSSREIQYFNFEKKITVLMGCKDSKWQY